MKQLISVKTNMSLEYSVETNTMQPASEVILLVSTPNYKISDNAVKRHVKLKEFRFKTSLEGINSLIGQLQVLSNSMNSFEQMGNSINLILETSKKELEKVVDK